VKAIEFDAADAPKIATDNPVPVPPFWGRRVVTDISPRHLFPYINENSLFRGQWGFKQGKLSERNSSARQKRKLGQSFSNCSSKPANNGVLQPKIVYGYFPVQSEGDDLIVYDRVHLSRGVWSRN